MKKIFFSGWGFQASAGDGLNGVEESFDFLHQQYLISKQPCVLVGWSLGGQMAIKAALHQPQNVVGLILISSTPCFCQKEGWTAACSDTWFQSFQQGIAQAHEKHLSRFMTLMLRGEKLSNLQRQTCLKSMQHYSVLEKPALLQGLQMLHQHDLREQLRHLKIPVLLIHGKNDQVIPWEASAWMAQEIPKSSLYSIQDCGHAPLWTHTQTLNQVMENWCQQTI